MLNSHFVALITIVDHLALTLNIFLLHFQDNRLDRFINFKPDAKIII